MIPPQSLQGVTIAGTGMALPKHSVGNEEIRRQLEKESGEPLPEGWDPAQRTGIHTRYCATKKETVVSLGATALRQALKSAHISPGELDGVIAATIPCLDSPPAIPAIACKIVDSVSAIPAWAVDLNFACSGFLAAMNFAANTITLGGASHIAVIGTETFTKVVDWSDRDTCFLFGDGAGAVVLSAVERGRGCIYYHAGSDGSRGELMAIDPESGKFSMSEGRAVFRFAVDTLVREVKSAMEACNLTPDEVGMVIPHQFQTRILEAIRKGICFPREKFYVNVEGLGNTIEGTIPICLHQLWENNKIKKGEPVILAATGAGLSWATSVWVF